MTIRYQTAVYSTLVFLVLFFGITSSAQAQIFNSGVALHNAEIVSQEDNEVSLGFDFVNGKGVQTGVKYIVELSRDSQGGIVSQTIVDSFIYSEVLSLSPDSSTHKEITYNAPEYLSGDYTLWIRAKNTNGWSLGVVKVGPITFSGSGNYVEITSETCFTEVQNDNNRYNLSDIVGAYTDEEITTTCTLINHTDNSISLTPTFVTRVGNQLGNIVQTLSDASAAFTLESGEEKEVAFTLDKVDTGQINITTIALKDSGGSLISNSVVVNYIVDTASATIVNVTFNKESYEEGETIDIDLSLSRKIFLEESSYSPRPDDELPILLSIKVIDKSGRLCGDPLTEKEPASDSEDNSVGRSISITATQDCDSPQIVTTLTMGDEVIFEGTTQKIEDDEDGGGFSGVVVGILLALLLIIALTTFLKRRGKTTIPLSVIMMIVIPIITIGALIPRANVEGFYLAINPCISFSSTSTAPPSSLTSDKAVYKPGEIVTLTWVLGADGCHPYPDPADVSMYQASSLVFPLKYTMTLISSTPTERTYSRTFTVPSTQGLYIFNAYASFLGFSPGPPSDFGVFVVVAEATASISASPNPVPSGSPTSITWGSINATGCTGTGTEFSTGGGPGGTDPTTGPLSTNTTYSVTCSGGIDIGSWSFVRTDSEQLYIDGVLSYPDPCLLSSIFRTPYDGMLDDGAKTIWDGESLIIIPATTEYSCFNTTFDWFLGDFVNIYKFTPNSVFIAGNTALASKLVTISAPLAIIPTIDTFSAPSTITAGSSATITWSSTNATSCTGGGTGFSTGGSVSGSDPTGALSVGTHSYTLSCTSSTGHVVSSPAISIDVTATPGDLSVTSSGGASHSFGTITIGNTPTWNFTLKNTGGTSLSGSVSGLAAPFTCTSGCSYTISAGATKTVAIKYTPTSAIFSSDSFTFTGGAGVSASVTGTGQTVGAISVTSSGGASHSFGTITIGNTPTWNFTLKNTGGTSLSGSVSGLAAPFTCTSGCSYTLAGGASTNVVVKYTPTSAISSTDSFTFTGGAGVSASVTGTGQTAGSLSVTSSGGASHSFGTITIGNTPTWTFTLKNTGGASLTGSVSGLAAPFTCTSGCSYTLAGGASTNVVVKYTPTSAISSTDSFTFTGGAGVSASVTGTGELVTQVTSVTASPFASILTGDNVTINWTSEGATTCTGTNFTISPNTKTSGSETINNLTADTLFIVRCSGDAGGEDSDNITVNVIDPTPSIHATPPRVLQGSHSVLRWTSRDVTACTLYDPSNSGTSGSYTTPGIDAEVTYTLTCTASLGPDVSATATIRPFTPIFEEI